MTAGSLALILHAHLPFVRHPEHESFLEEAWLFEAITESYVPLLRTFQRLQAERIPVKLTVSVSPPLCAMLRDELLCARYVRHLDYLIALANDECERNRADEILRPLSEFYRQLFTETRRVFTEEWNCDLLAFFRAVRDDGAVELIASAATHSVLPILEAVPAAVRAQVAIGCDIFREIFGVDPIGFWLPECAYAPGIERWLQEENIRWFVVDSHALNHARPRAKRGSLAPCFTPGGPAAFARDLPASRQVWSAEGGYPGDAMYRDFYRDVGFDLPLEGLPTFARGEHRFTGIKYYRVTGPAEPKQLYDPAAALETARRHARHFIEQRIAQLQSVSADSWNPIVVIPFDAELFGHWWFEGPSFLEHIVREVAASGEIELTTPSDFLAQNQTQQIVQPASSSWGDKGYLDVWLDETCSWIYPRLYAATQQMITLAKSHAAGNSDDDGRVLRQLARELLLAQSSDWPFLIRNGTAKEYAAERVADHLRRFDQLAQSFANEKVDIELLAQCEERDNLFPNLDWRYFA